MANFNAMFAGCESFMEGDVEINNDVTIPASDGEALEAESVAEDVGAEGGEIVGEAETTDTKAEAANMVFDQVLNMYRHVKQNGIDRTFLSLYNNQGQLNSMIGYKFPSCESMDSVGSPRSSASRAFISAMESDGAFSKIWQWIKEQWAKLVKFVRKVMDWFREAFGNLDLRVGKLTKYFTSATDKKWGEVKSTKVRYISNKTVDAYNTTFDKTQNALMLLMGEFGGAASISKGTELGDLANGIMTAQKYMAERFKDIGTNADNGKIIDSKTIDGLNKGLEPFAKAVGEIGSESEELSKLKGKGGFNVEFNNGKLVVSEHEYSEGTDENECGVKASALKTLGLCKDTLSNILKMRQAMDMMKRANENAGRAAAQEFQRATGESQGSDAVKDAKEKTLGAVKMCSVCVKILNVQEKFVAKLCKVIASYTSCVSLPKK